MRRAAIGAWLAAASAGVGWLGTSGVQAQVVAAPQAPSGAAAARPPASPDRGNDADKSVGVTLGPWRFLVGAPPTGWTDGGFDDRAWGGPAAGPFAPKQPPLPEPPPAATFFDLVPGAPLLLRGRFSVTDPSRVRVLELRVAYADGFIATLNGREIARRGLAPSGGAATAPHGPELEHVFVPVPSKVAPSLQADGNLLAVAVFPYPGRNTVVPTAPAAFVDLAAWSGVRIVRGPYLSAPADDKTGAGLRINWQTDRPAAGTISLQRIDAGSGAPLASEPPRRIALGARATEQLAKLSGLARGAAYRYTVEADAGGGDTARSGPWRFETLPAPPHPLRFAVYGDMRYPGHVAHRSIVEALVREAPAVVFNTGDLTDVGSEESNWQRYFEITAPMGGIAPVVPALGNHDADRHGTGAAKTWKLFGLPAAGPPGWSSLDLGGVHFVLLSTNEMRDPAQRAWLADDLARSRRHHARAIFAFCHEGPWAHGLHGGSSQMVRDYAPLLAAAHVDVLFSGHDHIYERGVGTTPAGKLTYVVTGGGGAPLYNPRCAAASSGNPERVPTPSREEVGPAKPSRPHADGPPPGDVPGPLPPCPPSVAVLTKAYHYLMVEVAPEGITLCPRRPDGSPVEACVHLPAHR
jgi:Calcineurin-like phosphoesterase